MRTILVGLTLVLVGCVSPNPDYLPAEVGGPDGGISQGPGPDLSGVMDASQPGVMDAGANDLKMGEPKDFAMSEPEDFAMSEPDLPMSIGEGVVCGSEVCAAPQFCCVGWSSRSCVSPGLTSCIAGKNVQCDGPEDCSVGDQCCAGLDGASCHNNCDANRTVCHTAVDCPDADYCCPTDTGYGRCSKDPC